MEFMESRVHKGAGFTLLEMLVALAIVAIAVGAATVALRPDEQRRVDDEAQRLALLLEQASEESELGGRPLAWVAEAAGYEFQRRELTEAGSEWNVARGDDLLHPRRLPAGVNIRCLELDRRPCVLGERIRLGPPRPLLVEFSLGHLRARVVGNSQGFQAVAATGEAL